MHTRYGNARQSFSKGLIPAAIAAIVAGIGTYVGYRAIERHGFAIGYFMGSPDAKDIQAIVDKVNSGMTPSEVAKDFYG